MINLQDYFGSYNDLISQVAKEFNGAFAALASPTLSKQETVSGLHNQILANREDKKGYPLLEILLFIPRLVLAAARLIYGSIQFRVKALPKDAVYFRTWLLPQCFRDCRVDDDFFRGIVREVAKRDKVVIVFCPLDYSLLSRFKLCEKPEGAIISCGLLGLRDIIKLFGEYLFTGLIQAKKKYYYDNCDVTSDINRSLLLDYLCLNSFAAYQEKYICKKLSMHSPKGFIYVYENQALEKSACQTLRFYGVPLIGYQSSGFSPLFLNFFPTEVDTLLPMPDVIFTVGDYFAQYLKQYGHYKIPVETLAAVRFSYPNELGKYCVKMPYSKVQKRVIYAFSVRLEQYESIIKDLIEIFGGVGVDIDLKLHPTYEFKKIPILSALPANFRIVSKVSMEKLSEVYDCVIFNDNSFGIEALFFGVRSFQYNHDGEFIDERFIYFDYWETHLDYHGLKMLRDEISSGSFSKEYNIEFLREYLNKMYRPLTTNCVNQLYNYIPS